MSSRTKRTGGSKKNPVTVSGAWLPLSLDFLRSAACASLSPLAAKLLLDLMSRLQRNARGNGDVAADPKFLEARGWTSKASRESALRELIDAQLLAVTRQGGRNRCSLYAIVLWPLDCDLSKLDAGPGSYRTDDWARVPNSERPPTMEEPAIWRRPRKGNSPTPAAGATGRALPPPRGKARKHDLTASPATGAVASTDDADVPPPRGTYLELPSGAAARTRFGRLLCRVTPQHRPKLYEAVRTRFASTRTAVLTELEAA